MVSEKNIPLPPRGLEAAFSSFAAPSSGNLSKSKSSHVRVVARIRPLSQAERTRSPSLFLEPLQPSVAHDTKEEYKREKSSAVVGSPARRKRKPFAFLSPERRKWGAASSPAKPTTSTGATPVTRNYRRMPPSPEADVSSRPAYGNAQSLMAGKMDTSLRKFDFDAVFSPGASQQEVYDRSVGDAVRRNIFLGYNTTIVAYGQTGSGKTYTMSGRDETEDWSSSSTNANAKPKASASGPPDKTDGDGIIPRSVVDLFKAKQRHESAADVSVILTYLEIYNDEILDLLSDADSSSSSLKLQDQGGDGVVVRGLTSVRVNSAMEVQEIMSKAATRRKMGSTKMNIRSSRSHAVCTLSVVMTPAVKAKSSGVVNRATSEVISARLTLVDLVGSERIKQIGVVGVAQQESININKDLFVLAKVVSALAEKSKRKDGAKVHVPYRDSKLTRLLRDSLGGNCCTVMVACVSPAATSFDESLNTLRYAERTRAITNSIKQNVVKAVLTPAESAAMRKENKLLKAKVVDMKKRLHLLELSSTSSRAQQVKTNDADHWRLRYEKLLTAAQAAGFNEKCTVLTDEEERILVGQRKEIVELRERLDQLQNGDCQGDSVSLELSLAMTDDTDIDEKRNSLEKLREETSLQEQQHSEIKLAIATSRAELAILNQQVLKARANVEEMVAATMRQEKDLAAGRAKQLAYLNPAHNALSLRTGEEGIEMASFQTKHRVSLKAASDQKPAEEAGSLKEAARLSEEANVKLTQDLQRAKQRVIELEKAKIQKKSHIPELMVQLSGEQTIRREQEEKLRTMSKELDTLQVQCAMKEDNVKRLQDELSKSVSRDQLEELQKELTATKSQYEELKKRAADKENSVGTEQGAQLESRGILSEKNQFPSGKDDTSLEKREFLPANPAGSFDDTTIDTDEGVEAADASSHEAIRIQAAKMLYWANKAIEKGRSSRSVCSSVASSNGSEFKPDLVALKGDRCSERIVSQRGISNSTLPPGKPPRAMRSGAKVESEAPAVVISNMDDVKTAPCSCKSSLFSGNAAHADFYLPKLGMACECGKHKPVESDSDKSDPTALSNILRQWQVDFLSSVHINTAEELVRTYNKRGGVLAKEMRKWRKANKLVSVKTASCKIALHIWTRTCKVIVRSVRSQRANGVKVLKRPDILEITLSGDNTVSTLGGAASIDFTSQAEF